MIFHDYKTIFVHIPKAGGTSIENLLWPDSKTRTDKDLWMGFISRYYNKYQTGGLQHLLASQIIKEVGEKIFFDYYKFALVRNPWSRALSQFIYMSKREDLRSFINMNREDSFLEYLNLIQLREHVQWKPQIDFILDGNGELLIDNFFKLEQINNNYGTLSKNVGANFDKLPHLNKGNYSSFKDYYNKESIEIVSEIYKEDIGYFNYQFS